jgi:hypothetical protein
MANVSNPHGLRPLGRTLSGGFPTVETYQKAVGDAQAIYIFDALSRLAGFVSGTSTPGTTLFTGVALNAGLASVQTDHLVMNSPDAMFEAQCSDTSTAALMGYNANLTLNAPSVTVPTTAGYTGISGHIVGTLVVTAAKDVHVHRLYSQGDNAYGANSRVEISFNRHALTPASTLAA